MTLAAYLFTLAAIFGGFGVLAWIGDLICGEDS